MFAGNRAFSLIVLVLTALVACDNGEFEPSQPYDPECDSGWLVEMYCCFCQAYYPNSGQRNWAVDQPYCSGDPVSCEKSCEETAQAGAVGVHKIISKSSGMPTSELPSGMSCSRFLDAYDICETSDLCSQTTCFEGDSWCEDNCGILSGLREDCGSRGCRLGYCHSSWLDSETGLEWQNPDSDEGMTWDDAVTYCKELTFDNGGWRLPTISELRTLVRNCPSTEVGGICGVTTDCTASLCRGTNCDGCAAGQGPVNGYYWPEGFDGSFGVWSSSEDSNNTDHAWFLAFDRANLIWGTKSENGGVRCVR